MLPQFYQPVNGHRDGGLSHEVRNEVVRGGKEAHMLFPPGIIACRQR
jgi:hypothetical protein